MPAKKHLLDHTRNLSRKQQRVVEFVALGLKNSEIASELGIGPNMATILMKQYFDFVIFELTRVSLGTQRVWVHTSLTRILWLRGLA